MKTHPVYIEPSTYRMYYDVISNSTLWYIHHGLFDAARRPLFDQSWRSAWSAYREVNLKFSEALAEHAPENATILIQDYHLTLIAKTLDATRPDLKTVHFHHTPFAEPSAFAMLPDDVCVEILEGLISHTSCGFHAEVWADNFSQCCQKLLGQQAKTFVSPAPPDVNDLLLVEKSSECELKKLEIDEIAKDKKLIVRVDRMELSKNILRGFLAFDYLLENNPNWREKVTFAALVYPSRENLADYLAYRNQVEGLVQQINNRWQSPNWTPIVLISEDNFARSVAALNRYDVLLVNPIRDGLNLVAKEGAIANQRNGVIVLSHQAGVWHEFKDWVISINPFDIVATSKALQSALELDEKKRMTMANKTKSISLGRSASDWLNDQLLAITS